jgi:hypothetical protein
MDGKRGKRELFDERGSLDKAEAYRLITEARPGTKFVRIILSPDPNREDTRRDLDMRGLTVATIAALQRRLKRPVPFIAAVHDDHTDIRHVHIIALVHRRLCVRDFKFLIRAATVQAQRDRRILDRQAGIVRERTVGKHARSRVVVTAKGGEQAELQQSHTAQSQTVLVPGSDTPTCPNAGMQPHPVKRTKTGRFWCGVCLEKVPERNQERTLSGRGLVLQVR